MVHLKINNIPVEVKEGTTILEAAKIAGINIPTLCYLKEINEIGACRICVVEVKGARSLVAACVYPVNEGMEVFTNTEKVRKSRKTTLELLLSDHKKECLSCVRSTNCELQKLSNEYGCDENRFKGARSEYEQDTSTSYLVRDNEKCILCRRCVAVCKKVQEVAVIAPAAAVSIRTLPARLNPTCPMHPAWRAVSAWRFARPALCTNAKRTITSVTRSPIPKKLSSLPRLPQCALRSAKNSAIPSARTPKEKCSRQCACSDSIRCLT